MSATDVARRHYRDRERLGSVVDAEGGRLWRQVRHGNTLELDTWLSLLPRLAVILAGAQLAAAQQAEDYVAAALAEQGSDVEPDGQVAPEALSGVASDGRPLGSLLVSPVVATTEALGRGASAARALAVGQAVLSMILRTQVADAGRVADQVAIATRPGTGWIRMLNPPSCARCAILAGKFYRYNSGFRRHPRCNCIHVPARNERAARTEGLLSDPRDFFRSLSRSEQDRVFTKSGAESIRLGADIFQVVNARRGAAGLSTAARLTREEDRLVRGGDQGRLRPTTVFGQDVFVTTEGTTARGIAGQRLIAAGVVGSREETVRRLSREGVVERQVTRRRVQTPRLMPESILQLAKDQADAIRLLRRFGYII